MHNTLPLVGAVVERCPDCSGKHIVRKGQRKKKLAPIHLWRCNDCLRVFTPQPIRSKTFPLPVILNAVSLYNRGYSVCLLYTSDAADDLTRVDLGGRRCIKQK